MTNPSASVEVAIIGSGFGGLCAAINLLKRGIDDFVILERRHFMGGTWFQNRYPGAAVDVQSALYSLADEPYDWRQLFAEGDELRNYTQAVIDKYQLAAKTRLNWAVGQASWCEESERWQLARDSGEQLDCRFLINATGPLSTPVIPEFPGRETFQGASFHTNDWDTDYDHRGKRVAVIGSGASAAQVIPAIADEVSELHVFQRTPHWVIPRPDYVFKPWQRKLLQKRGCYQLLRKVIYWALEGRVLGFKYSKTFLNLVARSRAMKLLKRQVLDDTLRAKLTPDYTIGCKRIILSDTLYPALTKASTQLHDKNDGIARITEQGIVTTQGQEIPLDLIVYSTGFDATDGLISYPVHGRGGVALRDKWQTYPRAYLGTTVPDFPNLFIVTGPNTGIGHTSALFIIESQMNYIMNCIERVRSGDCRTIEVKADAESRYTQHIHSEMERTVWKSGGCNSWYQSKSGHVIAMFPGFSFTYRRWTRNFRAADHHLS
ncbi:cation diffusion facilitator CzcD-associated flavoprotein CzcO [Litorivivens lipolytica]|uniref:Cation diffusion facilitator CzcD-associated flavoprotein CzcO n=1 Tax=Litorivivens lipolytica TaxID=1524264 RepID=A0A7W4W613_9GAMM|nr:NAD(P)/FAD-dependent oxidoreductase [Litorivivens lipolytica]MBB3047519.1 cation diffusion facilitator CzcD-associated flavoprotein CzcO [Litorivivens lipolytica]